MNATAYRLGDARYIEQYREEFTGDQNCIYSLTITLNPRLYNADILTQYREAVREIKKLFYYRQGKSREIVWNPYIYKVYVSPELTKTNNIHFHGIVVCDPTQAHNIRDTIKGHTWKCDTLGRQHSFKQIDMVTTELINYPFKDLETLKKYSSSDKIYSLLFVYSEKNI